MLARTCSGIMSLVVAVVLTSRPATSATITVPNASFESPATSFVNTNIDNWTKPAQPAWWSSSYGYDWSQLTGIFGNTASGSSDHINNMDGNQAAWLFAVPQNALFQDLSAKFAVGQSYNLTVGIIGHGGNMLDCVTMQIGPYYRDGSNNIVPVGATTVTCGSVADNGMNHLQDFSFVLPSVLVTDAWAGANIGVQLLSTADFGNMGGYWDVDNVRLTSVPEPASMTLLALGVGAFLLRRRARS